METPNDDSSQTQPSVRSEIIAAVSHQLRDPIAYARFVFQSLINDPERTLRDEDVALIKKADARLFDVFELTEKLLLADKISYTDLPLQPEKISLNELLLGVITESEPLAIKKNISLHKPYTTENVFLVADEILLREAIKNIVHNAIKYTPGGGSVTISYKQQDSDFRIDIADTGVGVSEDEASQLFSKYHRLSNAYLTSGFGLGLYLAKKFVEFHGGTITYTQNQPHGSIFTISLPQTDILVK